MSGLVRKHTRDMSNCQVDTGPCKCDECEEYDVRYDQNEEEAAEYNNWKYEMEQQEQMERMELDMMFAESYIFEKNGMVLTLANGEPTGMDDGWRLVEGMWEKVGEAIDQWSGDPSKW